VPVEEQVVVIYRRYRVVWSRHHCPVGGRYPVRGGAVDGFRAKHADLLSEIRDTSALPDAGKT